jgi:hypothetical protein
MAIVDNGSDQLFAIYLPPKELAEPGISLNDTTHQLIALDSPYFGDFYGGTCIADQTNQCLFYVNLE